jgi:SAM-dependent methyltransferase
LVKGALTFIPGVEGLLPKRLASHDPPASYYYEVWLKHLAFLHENKLYNAPEAIAELGPGDSLGIGIAALLSGANCYYGLDVVAHTDLARNLKVLDELLGLFERRAPRPETGWPNYDHLLDPALFPSQVLTEQVLAAALTPDRIASIRRILATGTERDGAITIAYRAPWHDPGVVVKSSMDLILSQAVLEHVTDIRKTYEAMYQWLKPGGVISHQIDFRSHGLTNEWNGYRAMPEWLWKTMLGRRVYMINREPCSAHIRAMTACGFEIVDAQKRQLSNGISRSRLSRTWRDISDDDLNCSELFVQARKPATSS